jgi:imidazole glycerol phosphate synthase glutamine amidotransferase subunit
VITIVDYGAGNLRSVQNTLAELGAGCRLVRDADGVFSADKLILPGVGHFGHLMRSIDALGLREPLLDRIRAGVPFLGICLGLQALFESSQEASGQPGFALFRGVITRFDIDARVPHMGWDSLDLRNGARLTRGLPRHPYVYFAHSYYAPVVDAAVATCTYVVPYTAALERDNVFGVQFHPEKSGPIGLQVVRNFVEL